MSPPIRAVSVAVPVPALGCLSYAVPEHLPVPEVGTRVLVPLGTRLLTGCVIDRDLDSAPDNLKPLSDLLDTTPLLPADVVRLALWVGDYYASGPGPAIAAAMPPRAWVVSERHAQITAAGREALATGPSEARRQVLELLTDGAPHPVARLARVLAEPARGQPPAQGGLYARLNALARDGLVTLTQPLKGTASAFKSVTVARPTVHGLELLDSGARLGTRQLDALRLVSGSPGGLTLPDLERQGVSRDTVRRLVGRGALTTSREVVNRDPWLQGAQTLTTPHGVGEPGTTASEVVLTAEQQRAVESLAPDAGSGTFSVALLHGVTGSGKTEIYLRLARAALARGRQALMLVPEIALTPAVATRFRRAFGDRVAVQHSGLSEGARHDQWHRIRRGEIDVVVGTRSAVFAPLPSVGLIVVDEEHDASYKQEESPRYHGRDVAVMRAKHAGALAVLGSATPALETYRHAEQGRYRLVVLSERVLSRPLPTVHVIDMREEFAEHGPDVVLSGPLVEGLGARLERGEQAVVLLNRRGFAASVFCRQCARSLECPNCSVSLTFHRRADRARCHYCGYSRARPERCPECRGDYLEQIGFGTERVEAEITARWPDARVARLDRDTVRRQGAAARLLDRFGSGAFDILVGTQMVAKGHDFPRVTLVGVISADVGLGVADFRAGERTFQLLTQVAGRAGRGTLPGEAMIQTLYPNHYSIRYACRQAYEPFFVEELAFRTAMHYPPDVALVSAVVRAPTFNQAMQEAAELAQWARAWGNRFTVLGPASAPLGRLKGQYRAQVLLKGAQRGEMRRAMLAALEDRGDLKRRVVVDVDPLSML
ncbi:MAG: primosomal protein N' [Acidobacteria bacterium]|nr:primosomal protein N' [Acidobacteriota bacterium]